MDTRASTSSPSPAPAELPSGSSKASFGEQSVIPDFDFDFEIDQEVVDKWIKENVAMSPDELEDALGLLDPAPAKPPVSVEAFAAEWNSAIEVLNKAESETDPARKEQLFADCDRRLVWLAQRPDLVKIVTDIPAS